MRDVDDARNQLAHASQELKALEKHKENWVTATKKEMKKKAAEKADEVGQTIFMFNKNR